MVDGLVVVLEDDIKDKDLENIKALISTIKGVKGVNEHDRGADTIIAEQKAKNSIIEDLIEVINRYRLGEGVDYESWNKEL